MLSIEQSKKYALLMINVQTQIMRRHKFLDLLLWKNITAGVRKDNRDKLR